MKGLVIKNAMKDNILMKTNVAIVKMKDAFHAMDVEKILVNNVLLLCICRIMLVFILAHIIIILTVLEVNV